MKFIGQTIVSDDLKMVSFCCDLQLCKGACCVEGDAGAPLEEEEVSLLEDQIGNIEPFMTHRGIEQLKESGVFDYDAGANLVTPLVKGRECIYVYFEDGIARCAIEKAFEQKKITFQKPLSCHLYPVRISRMKEYEAVNYHKWGICSKALERGQKEHVPLYRFLEEALTRKYGAAWYEQLSAP